MYLVSKLNWLTVDLTEEAKIDQHTSRVWQETTLRDEAITEVFFGQVRFLFMLIGFLQNCCSNSGWKDQFFKKNTLSVKELKIWKNCFQDLKQYFTSHLITCE